MSATANKDVALAHMQAWNNKDLEAFDHLFAQNYVHNDPAQPDVRDLFDFKLFTLRVWSAFPDLHGQVIQVLAEGELVAKRYILSGTHQGRFAGVPATGTHLSITGMTFYRFENGRIVEAWLNYDLMSLMQQIGAVPQPA